MFFRFTTKIIQPDKCVTGAKILTLCNIACLCYIGVSDYAISSCIKLFAARKGYRAQVSTEFNSLLQSYIILPNWHYMFQSMCSLRNCSVLPLQFLCKGKKNKLANLLVTEKARAFPGVNECSIKHNRA